MIAGLGNFLNENAASRTTDRGMLTMELMQRLATFLTGFPGRKNVIWFSESFPLIRQSSGTQASVDPDVTSEFEKTMAMLAAARVALYQVDARGTDTVSFYQADNKLPSSTSAPYQIIGVDSAPSGRGGNGPGRKWEDFKLKTLTAQLHATPRKRWQRRRAARRLSGQMAFPM